MDAPPPLAPTQPSLENTRCAIKVPRCPLSSLSLPAHPPHISIPEATVPPFPEPTMPSHHLSLTNSYSSLKTQSNFMYQHLTLLVHPCLPFLPTPGVGGGVAQVYLDSQKLQLRTQRRHTMTHAARDGFLAKVGRGEVSLEGWL